MKVKRIFTPSPSTVSTDPDDDVRGKVTISGDISEFQAEIVLARHGNYMGIEYRSANGYRPNTIGGHDGLSLLVHENIVDGTYDLPHEKISIDYSVSRRVGDEIEIMYSEATSGRIEVKYDRREDLLIAKFNFKTDDEISVLDGRVRSRITPE